MHPYSSVHINCKNRLFSVASDPWNPWKSWKSSETVDTPEKVPERPRNMGWSLKNMKKKTCENLHLVQNDSCGGHQFCFLYFYLRQAITVIAYCFTDLFFPLYPICVHPSINELLRNSHCPRASRALEKPSIDTEIAQKDTSINS